MPLNPSKGNMYPFVTHTWNTVKGKCPHDCSYCYMKRFKQGPIRFDKKELETDLGQDNFIFVGSSCDMFADEIHIKWINLTTEHCRTYNNQYLFQTKNPQRISKLLDGGMIFTEKIIFGTTIETNRFYEVMGKSPLSRDRADAMMEICDYFKTMVTVEPIMDFDLDILVKLISKANPQWVNIGADSQGHNLPEPPKEKILDLIEALKEFTEVKIKKNLNRLLK